MSAPVSRPPRSGGSLHATRQQLDELDALLQRMLDLPVQQTAEPEPESAAEETVLPFRSAALERARAALAARLDRPGGAGQAAPGYPPAAEVPPPVPPPPPPARGVPPSYLVVETAGSPYPPGMPAGESPLGPRLVPGQEAEFAGESYPNPYAGDNYRQSAAEPPAEAEPPPEDWVPLRSSWQPSAQTWKPLAESWEQVRGPNPGMPAIPPPPPIPPIPPIPQPRAEMPVQPPHGMMPPLRHEGPSGPMVVTRQAPFHGPVETGPADSRPEGTSYPPPLPRVPPVPGALPRLPSPPAVAPPAAPAALLPLVWFNRAFDLLLLPFGPAGRWLRGPGGRSLLGAVGLLCLAAAVVLALADRFGWTG